MLVHTATMQSEVLASCTGRFRGHSQLDIEVGWRTCQNCGLICIPNLQIKGSLQDKGRQQCPMIVQ